CAAADGPRRSRSERSAPHHTVPRRTCDRTTRSPPTRHSPARANLRAAHGGLTAPAKAAGALVWSGSQLTEARERVGGAIGLEVLDAGEKTIDSEQEEIDLRSLPGAAAGEIGAGGCPHSEQRVRSQREDLVRAFGVDRADLEEAANCA